MSIISFRDHLTPEAFRAWFEHYLTPRPEDAAAQHAWREALCAWDKEFGIPATAAFLQAKRDAGEISRFTGVEGHRFNLVTAWNGMIDGSAHFVKHEVGAWRDIYQATIRRVPAYMSFDARKAVEQGTMSVADATAAAYEKVVSVVDSGGLPSFLLSSDIYCFVTGERYQMTLEGWKVGLVDLEGKPIQPVTVDPIIEHQVTFATGDLIIADWPRVKAFTDLCSKTIDDIATGPDLNCARGRAEMTRRYLEEMNVVSVHGGGSPRVLRQPGGLVLAHRADFEVETPALMDTQHLGRVDTQYRAVTIIERQRLVDLVREGGSQDPERDVEIYLASARDDIVRVKVNPGTYWLYFSPDHAFEDHFAARNFQVDPNFRPAFVLSENRLELTARLEAEAGEEDPDEEGDEDLEP